MGKKRCDTCTNYVKGNNALCSTCASRKSRAKNPMRYSFITNRNNAKRRGKEWELTFEEFAQFAYEEDYLVGKGISKKSYSIDREDETMGYFIGNIRVLPLDDNTRRRYKKLEYDWFSKNAFVVRHKIAEPDEDDPF